MFQLKYIGHDTNNVSNIAQHWVVIAVYMSNADLIVCMHVCIDV